MPGQAKDALATGQQGLLLATGGKLPPHLAKQARGLQAQGHEGDGRRGQQLIGIDDAAGGQAEQLPQRFAQGGVIQAHGCTGHGELLFQDGWMTDRHRRGGYNRRPGRSEVRSFNAGAGPAPGCHAPATAGPAAPAVPRASTARGARRDTARPLFPAPGSRCTTPAGRRTGKRRAERAPARR